MNKTTSPQLRKMFSDVLSDMAFIFLSDPEEGIPLSQYTLDVHITYSGPTKGSLKLRCDGRFAAQVAANMLGVDPNDASARQARLDAVKELMNVVCGNLVTEFYGTDGLFELSIPEVSPVLPDEPAEDPEGSEVHVFLAEDAPIQLIHTVES